jgi:hypothetical protein
MDVISYGGGTNSLAVLCGLVDRGMKPDAIVFSDTGGERPHTYDHMSYLKSWLTSVGFPPITTVRVHQPSKYGSLEKMCLANKILPSVAYGFKSCSVQYKIEPFNRWVKQNCSGENVIRWIGIDAGEAHRAKEIEGNYYPLIEWDWDRDKCLQVIDAHGLRRPNKSSCFYCPNSRQSEVRHLAHTEPALFKRAVALEHNADLKSVKGLGRSYSWESLLATDDLFPEDFEREMPCGCYDG